MMASRLITFGEMTDSADRPGEDDVARFVDAIEDPVKREDSLALVRIMSEVTREEPKLWGSGVIGFGSSLPVCLGTGGRRGQGRVRTPQSQSHHLPALGNGRL